MRWNAWLSLNALRIRISIKLRRSVLHTRFAELDNTIAETWNNALLSFPVIKTLFSIRQYRHAFMFSLAQTANTGAQIISATIFLNANRNITSARNNWSVFHTPYALRAYTSRIFQENVNPFLPAHTDTISTSILGSALLTQFVRWGLIFQSIPCPA